MNLSSLFGQQRCAKKTVAAILIADLLAPLASSRSENTGRHMKAEAALFHGLPLSWVYRAVRSLLCLLESCVCVCVRPPIIIVDAWYKTSETICTTFSLQLLLFFIYFF